MTNFVTEFDAIPSFWQFLNFFRRQNRFFIEVSWPVNKSGKPQLGVGKFRYPIGYPEASHEARTGHTTYFNAPIVSDTERHGPARNEAQGRVERTTLCVSLPNLPMPKFT